MAAPDLRKSPASWRTRGFFVSKRGDKSQRRQKDGAARPLFSTCFSSLFFPCFSLFSGAGSCGGQGFQRPHDDKKTVNDYKKTVDHDRKAVE